MSSIVGGNSWHFHPLPAVCGGYYGASGATYVPRDPSHTVLYHVSAEHLETFLASLDADPDATGLPAYVEREFFQRSDKKLGALQIAVVTCSQ
jgi:hypothetical protein